MFVCFIHFFFFEAVALPLPHAFKLGCFHTRGPCIWIGSRLAPRLTNLGILRTQCGSNRAQEFDNCVCDHCAQIKSWTAAVFDGPRQLNQNTTAHGGCWSWKADLMVDVGISKVKNKMLRNKEDIYYTAVRPWRGIPHLVFLGSSSARSRVKGLWMSCSCIDSEALRDDSKGCAWMCSTPVRRHSEQERI